MSYWQHSKPVVRERAIAIADVARAAAGLLDAGGLRGLTLRAVAGELEVAPASLYSRVSTVDDLFDLALDHVLGVDPEMLAALEGATIEGLMLAQFRHVTRHPWVSQVIAMRAPRGPHSLALSERMCELLDGAGVADPLGTAYVLSNFVIGSAATAHVAAGERLAPVDSAVAPTYARLHTGYAVAPEELVVSGIAALLARA